MIRMPWWRKIFQSSTLRESAIGQRWTDDNGQEWVIRKIVPVVGSRWGTADVYGSKVRS